MDELQGFYDVIRANPWFPFILGVYVGWFFFHEPPHR